ncbi:MAG: hypothetical protein Q9166_006490 [cf. Caloplaca sp. 2 TL-2023]
MSEQNTNVNTTANTASLSTRETEQAVIAIQCLKHGKIELDEAKFAKMAGYSNAHSASVSFTNLKKKLNSATEDNYHIAAGASGTTPKKPARKPRTPKNTPTKPKADAPVLKNTPVKRTLDTDEDFTTTGTAKRFKKEDEGEEAAPAAGEADDHEV